MKELKLKKMSFRVLFDKVVDVLIQVMRIASISKPFTATIAAKLFEAGKLDLDKDILVFFLESFKKFQN